MPHSLRSSHMEAEKNGRHFPDDIFKSIFLKENVRILLKISMKFVPKIRINNIPTLVQIMAWRRLGGKPLSGPMMVCLLTHICVTRLQWVNVNKATGQSYKTLCGLYFCFMSVILYHDPFIYRWRDRFRISCGCLIVCTCIFLCNGIAFMFLQGEMNLKSEPMMVSLLTHICVTWPQWV